MASLGFLCVYSPRPQKLGPIAAHTLTDTRNVTDRKGRQQIELPMEWGKSIRHACRLEHIRSPSKVFRIRSLKSKSDCNQSRRTEGVSVAHGDICKVIGGT